MFCYRGLRNRIGKRTPLKWYATQFRASFINRQDTQLGFVVPFGIQIIFFPNQAAYKYLIIINITILPFHEKERRLMLMNKVRLKRPLMLYIVYILQKYGIKLIVEFKSKNQNRSFKNFNSKNWKVTVYNSIYP